MARKNKQIKDIQEALLSNTQLIKEQSGKLVPEINTLQIDEELLEKYKMLAAYYQKDFKDILHDALKHYLRLKALDVEQAMNEDNKA